MKRSGMRFPTLLSNGRLPLLAAVILLLSACDKDSGGPMPPHSPPRPITFGGGGVVTAQLDLTARPVIPPPGEM